MHVTIAAMRRVFILFCAALCACKHTTVQTRVLHVRVVAGPEFRQRPNWQDVITSRVQGVAGLLKPFDLALEVGTPSEWNPDPQMAPELKRREMGGLPSDGSWILLGVLSSAQDTGEPGIVASFDSRVIVYDIPSKSEAENQAAVAHLFGHIFGAWHSPDPKSIMHLPPGQDFDANAKQVLALTRSMDFRNGVNGLPQTTTDQISKLWADSKADLSTNPFYDYYQHQGFELLNTGRVEQAIEPLSRAVEIKADDRNSRFALATANMAMKRFLAAVSDYRKILEADPKNVAALNGLGGALLQSGQSAEAVDAFRKAVQLVPANKVVRVNLGVALIKSPGHLDEGIAELRDVLKTSPDDANVKAVLTAALDAKGKGRK